MDSQRLNKISGNGVRLTKPEAIEIGDDVDLDSIQGSDITIYGGSRIYGSRTSIHSGAVLGYEAPVTIENCYIGPGVQLKGGFYKDSVFLKGASSGSGAQVREGTIFEEEASVAHTVGLKQTILFPYVTLGSLVNFCDCFMAGGTSRKDHSEVGSSYIHFNYTPNQDKATASLIGDVPRGVMLDHRPIFLGGQGGLVGPCRMEYGTVVAAGSIWRKDQLKPDLLVFEGAGKGGKMPFTPGLYRSINRTIKNNIYYIANLLALRQWYIHVRGLFVSDDFPKALHHGLVRVLDMNIDERISRLGEFCAKMPESIRIYEDLLKEKASNKLINQKKEVVAHWDEVKTSLITGKTSQGHHKNKDLFLEKLNGRIAASGKDYLSTIQQLPSGDKIIGSHWLKSIVDGVVKHSFQIWSSV
ncbi:MAG: hypothetical protein HKM93_15220 [Desulfobacteraceae bacterium]|nr:hypothetical protein [Desulfobacteraceae bacterium]